jgi:hypothetical protein
MIEKMQKRDANMSFTSSKLSKKAEKLGWHPEAGIKKGLTVVLDAHTDIIKVR